MHDTRTILRGHIVAGDNSESTFTRIHPGYKLLVIHAGELGSLESGNHLERYELVALVVCVKSEFFGFRVKVCSHTCLGKHHGFGLACIGVVCAHHIIVDFRADTQSCIRRKSPWRGSPCQEVGLAPPFHAVGGSRDAELRCTGGILHIAVTSGLVELMGAQSGSGSRGIGLDGIAFIEIPFFVQLAEKPPHGLYIAVVVSDIRVIQVNPVAHHISEIRPFSGIFHHLAAAGVIIFVHRDFLTDILFGYAERFLHTELNRQAMGIPSGLTLYMKALHGLVAAHDIFYRARHHVVYARHTVGRGRALIENKRRGTFALLHALAEEILLAPSGEHLLVDI